MCLLSRKSELRREITLYCSFASLHSYSLFWSSFFCKIRKPLKPLRSNLWCFLRHGGRRDMLLPLLTQWVMVCAPKHQRIAKISKYISSCLLSTLSSPPPSLLPRPPLLLVTLLSPVECNLALHGVQSTTVHAPPPLPPRQVLAWIRL